MKLKSLKKIEILNNETIHLITGGTAKAENSKRKDIINTAHCDSEGHPDGNC